MHSGSLFVRGVVELVCQTLCKVSQIMEPCYGGELQDKAAMSDSKNKKWEEILEQQWTVGFLWIPHCLLFLMYQIRGSSRTTCFLSKLDFATKTLRYFEYVGKESFSSACETETSAGTPAYVGERNHVSLMTLFVDIGRWMYWERLARCQRHCIVEFLDLGFVQLVLFISFHIQWRFAVSWQISKFCRPHTMKHSCVMSWSKHFGTLSWAKRSG